MSKIKVMIVDDSAVMRNFLTDVLSKYSDIEVVATALDPYIAASKLSKHMPDVLTLDIEMPRMDGLTFLTKLMIANPLPVIMVSSLTEHGARETLEALRQGAVDFALKPNLTDPASKQEFAETLVEKVRTAAASKVKRRQPAPQPANMPLIEKKYSADVILAKKDPAKTKAASGTIIALGASTGGTEVIDEILINLDENSPAIVIAQHMPEKFTLAFANRVNDKSRLYVKEAENGDRLYRGIALVAPGGRHMLLASDQSGYYVEINDGPAVNRHKPSVDVLFRSVSQRAGASALGIICTGMGNDGAAGLLEMKQSGAKTLGQNEASCIVYGMPKEAHKLGAVDYETDVKGIIEAVKNFS